MEHPLPILRYPSHEGFICPLGKKRLIMLFWPILSHFWCPVVTLVNFSGYLGNIEIKKIQKITIKKSGKLKKNPKNPKKKIYIYKNCQKWSKNPKKS